MILASILCHNKNIILLDKVLACLKEVKGDFILEAGCFETETKVIEYFKEKSVLLDIYKRPELKGDDRVLPYTGMKGIELNQLSWLRNQRLEKTLSKEYSHHFSIDSDVLLESDILIKLLKEDKNIIGGWYFNKRFPNPACSAFPFLKDTEKYLEEKKVFRARTIGAGCMLLKRKIIEEGNRFSYKGFLFGEDYNFCLDLIKRGYKIWCDGSLYCEHLGKFKQKSYQYKEERTKQWKLAKRY